MGNTMSATEPETTGNGDSKGASVVVNAIAVLRTFTADEPLLGVTEIANRVGLHKSTVSRILATFEQEHLVERDAETRRFRLGLGLIAVAGPLLAEKTSVKLFDVSGYGCEGLGSVLVNDVLACEGEEGPVPACLDHLQLVTRTPVALTR